MNVLELTVLIWLGAFMAGFLGSLTGLGGGVVIVPLLALVFGVDFRYAIGASLVSVIATSSGAAAAYVQRRLHQHPHRHVPGGRHHPRRARRRLSSPASSRRTAIAIVFGVVLLYSAYLSRATPPRISRRRPEPRPAGDPAAARTAPIPRPTGEQAYHVQRVPLGFGLMFVAGALSGLLGIGSGAFKVLAMDQAMRLPFKVSTTTSNFMIGVTAAASAGIYLPRGYIDPGLAHAGDARRPGGLAAGRARAAQRRPLAPCAACSRWSSWCWRWR